MKKQSIILLLSGAIVWMFFFYPSSHSAVRSQTPGYLHTDGARIVDANGNQVILTGISWFGLETENFAPHGLWARNWESILDQIKELGFNTIRLPYSNQLFDLGSQPNGINEELNPDLKGLSGLEILDKLVQGAGERGLKIILDRHRPDSHAQSELWYTPQYDEQRWIQDWVMLAQRYQGNDTVIGFDLHNEPHGAATWGSGDPANDWQLAAEKAGNAVLAVNPNLLIIVEGIERVQDDWYWWGGNLIAARQDPVRLDVPNQLVYSTHVYGPGVYPQPWFSASDFPDNLPKIWDAHWGYLAREGIAPVLLGEFGGRSVGEDQEGIWQRTLVSYIRENDISYIYWTINPDSGDTGGLLLDDWQTIDPAKQALLSGYQFSIIGIEQAGTPPAAASAQAPTLEAPVATPSPQLPLPVLELSYRTANPGEVSQDAKPEFILVNKGNSPAPLIRVEIRYWFQDRSGQKLSYHCDWAQLGCGNIQGDFNQTDSGEQYLSLHFSASSGILGPEEATGELKIRFNRDDWSPFDQKDHYSFASQTDYAEWPKVTVYFDGQLVWGAEPEGQSASTQITPEDLITGTPILSVTQTAGPPVALLSQSTSGPTASEASKNVTQSLQTNRPVTIASFLLIGLLAGVSLGMLLMRLIWPARTKSDEESSTTTRQHHG